MKSNKKASKKRFADIARVLKDARRKANLSQYEVAERLGYGSAQFISNWERGLAAPPLMVLSRIAKMYNVNGEDLFQLILKDTEYQMRREFREGLG